MNRSQSAAIRQFIFLTVFTLLCCSCEKDETLNVQNLKYHIRFTDLAGAVMPNNDGNNCFIVDYSGGIVVKKKGGFIALPTTSGYTSRFVNDVYDDVNYNDNIVTVVAKSANNEYSVDANERIILLDDVGRMIKKTFKKRIEEVIEYSYNSKGQISHSLKTIANSQEKSEYTYSNGNVEKVVTELYVDGEKFQTFIETYREFDNTPNPFKNLGFFYETFRRSLSKNNYALYEYAKFDKYNNVISSGGREWELYYDANGNLIVTE